MEEGGLFWVLETSLGLVASGYRDHGSQGVGSWFRWALLGDLADVSFHEEVHSTRCSGQRHKETASPVGCAVV